MTTPTPPPGMEILTDYTKPLPEGAWVWYEEKSFWYTCARQGKLPDHGFIYAIPITHNPATELTIPPEVAAEVERAIDTSQEYREKTKDANFGTYGHPATGDANTEQREELSPEAMKWVSGDTTNEKGGEPCVEKTKIASGAEDQSALNVNALADKSYPASNAALDVRSVEQRQELPRYFVIAHDAEGNYETMECNNPVEGWFRLMWDNPTDVPADEVEDFKEFARNTDNWSLHSGQPTHLKWELEDGAIEFYLITHK